MPRRLIRKSNIHDVKTLFYLMGKVYIKNEYDRQRFMKDVGALLGLLASDVKILNPEELK